MDNLFLNKEKIEEYDNIFLTSDPHFHHEKIIQYCKRPFYNVEEMNETLISNWNDVVTDDSLVFLLGDVCLGNKNKMNQVMRRLNGDIIYIYGNHHRDKDFDSHRFTSMHDILYVDLNSKFSFYATHFPLMTWTRRIKNETETNFKCINAFGHVHHNPRECSGFDSNLPLWDNQLDVGVDNNNFYPWNLKDIIKIMDDRERGIKQYT